MDNLNLSMVAFLTAAKKVGKPAKAGEEESQETPAPVKKSLLGHAKKTISNALNWVSDRDVRGVQLFTRSIFRYGKMVIVTASVLALIGLIDFWQWLSAMWAAGTVVALCWREALANRAYAQQFALKEHSLSEILREEARNKKEEV